MFLQKMFKSNHLIHPDKVIGLKFQPLKYETTGEWRWWATYPNNFKNQNTSLSVIGYSHN